VYESWHYFSNTGFKPALATFIAELPEEEKNKESTMDKGTTVAEHHSAPFVWLESGGSLAEDGTVTGKTYVAVGGADKFREWITKEFESDPAMAEVVTAAKGAPSLMSDLFFENSVPGGTYLSQENSESEQQRAC